MIKVKLPIVEKTIDENNGRLVMHDREIDVFVDTSIYAEERWEINFPHNAKRETLFSYIERIQKDKLAESKAHILSNLKAIYCFMEGEEIADYKSFCQLFDLAEGTRLKKLMEKIRYVFDLVLISSAVSEKN